MPERYTGGMKPWLYRLGAYVAYPLLAAAGAFLLAEGDTTPQVTAGAVLLAADLALPAALGAWCRRCGEKMIPRLLRLLVLPAALCAALAFRSAQGTGQRIALAMIGVSAVIFIAAFRMTHQQRLPRQY